MPKVIEGVLTAGGQRYAIVVSRFHSIITNRLLEGALDCLHRHGASDEEITIHYCPGAFEIPQVALPLAASKKFDAVICLGAVIRGETPHCDYVASEATKGIAQAGLATGVPVSFGLLTTDTVEQAIERAGSKQGNKGWDAAIGAIEMVNLFRAMKKSVKN
ncbi:MAG: 6,7-dimethyl-8-ribityllumazine synthase [Ignavibacteriales bacterium CG07_land_8_20_14_0_80_59_12]|jgi:6,7-dimethyl-8-ribityllumazine synthase|nr:MAG: 6,7-dimethyl-8-ribityllumazine synthase [Ignavibacteriales bacterium CG07_land_8_20_14_0_80_59_12]